MRFRVLDRHGLPLTMKNSQNVGLVPVLTLPYVRNVTIADYEAIHAGYAEFHMIGRIKELLE